MNEYNCARCGGFVGEPMKAYGYAGQWCHCAEPKLPEGNLVSVVTTTSGTTPDKCMTTPRIEEIKAEFQMFVPDDDGSAMDWLENTLAEAHQAGVDEAVEVLVKRVMELQREWKSQEEEHGLANQGTIDRWAEAKLNRDTIEALQDNK